MTRETTYTLTEADYVTAQQTAFLRSIKRWRTMRNWLIIVTVCGGIGGAVSVDEPTLAGKLSFVFGFLAWGIVAIPLCWGLSYLLLPRRARRLFRQQRSLRRLWTYRWSEFGIENEGESGSVRLRWDELHAWTRGMHVFLFYANDLLFYMLPLHALSPAQVEDLQALLTVHGPVRR